MKAAIIWMLLSSMNLKVIINCSELKKIKNNAHRGDEPLEI